MPPAEMSLAETKLVVTPLEATLGGRLVEPLAGTLPAVRRRAETPPVATAPAATLGRVAMRLAAMALAEAPVAT